MFPTTLRDSFPSFAFHYEVARRIPSFFRALTYTVGTKWLLRWQALIRCLSSLRLPLDVVCDSRPIHPSMSCAVKLELTCKQSTLPRACRVNRTLRSSRNRSSRRIPSWLRWEKPQEVCFRRNAGSNPRRYSGPSIFACRVRNLV